MPQPETFAESPSPPSIERESRWLHDLPICVSIRLCHETMKLRELATMTPGDYIHFDVMCDAAAELRVGSLTLATGETMRHGHQLGFRLHKLTGHPNDSRDASGQPTGHLV